MVIEVTGGVGAGKSRILQILREDYGAEVMETDRTARELERRGQPGYRRLTEIFGGRVLGTDGEVDRRKLAEMIFSDRAALNQVNGAIHPMVWEEVHRKVKKFRGEKTDRRALFAVETAVPDPAPEGVYDEIWYVSAPEEERIRRLAECRGYTREKCLAVMAGQCTEEEYRAIADRVIDNSGGAEDVRRRIGEILG